MKSLNDIQEYLDHTKNVSSFRQSVRAEIRALWLGDIFLFTFVDNLTIALTRNLTIAWNEGAQVCGIQPDELTTEETRAREDFINSQFPYLLGFGDAIEINSRANGGELSPLLERGELWVGRYNEAFERGKGMACGNQKETWVLGATEKHCKSCYGFSGRVYRLSVWEANGARPQSKGLCCGGWRCDCRREQTTQRITPGPFPKGLMC